MDQYEEDGRGRMSLDRKRSRDDMEERIRKSPAGSPPFGNRAAAELMEGVIQRAVPQLGSAGFPKPAAVLAYDYRPQGDNLIFDGRVHPRPQDFIPGTREAVLSRYSGVSHITGFDIVTGQSMSLSGIQLDHIVSWHDMSQAMTKFNKQRMMQLCVQKGLEFEREDSPGRWTGLAFEMGVTDIAGEFYTLADAKRYFNDIDNLQPVSGGANAQAGTAGVAFGALQDSVLAPMAAQVQTGLMSLQTRVAVQTLSNEQREEVALAYAQIQEIIAGLGKTLDNPQ